MKFRMLLSTLLLGAGLVFVAGCDSPEKGFKEWKSAIAKGDVTKANERTTKDGQKLVALAVEGIKDDAKAKEGFEKLEIVSCTKKDDTHATLKVKDPDGKENDVEMVKEDGKWKVEIKK